MLPLCVQSKPVNPYHALLIGLYHLRAVPLFRWVVNSLRSGTMCVSKVPLCTCKSDHSHMQSPPHLLSRVIFINTSKMTTYRKTVKTVKLPNIHLATNQKLPFDSSATTVLNPYLHLLIFFQILLCLGCAF